MKFSYYRLLLVHGELLLLDGLELVPEVELGRLLLQFGELVLIFGHLLQGRLDAGESEREMLSTVLCWTPCKHSQFAPQVVDSDVKLIDLKGQAVLYFFLFTFFSFLVS